MTVAKRGVIVGFMNSWSLHRFSNSIPTTIKKSLNPFKVARMAARIAPGCRIFSRSVLLGPPSSWKDGRICFYLTQASTRPPTFVAFVNAKHLFHFSYQRYLINQIRENFGLEHTPIRLVVRERGSGEVGAKDV